MNTLITCHENADFDAFAALVGASLLYSDAYLLFPGTQENNLQRYIEEVANSHFQILSTKAFNDLSDEDLDKITRLVVVDTKQKSRLSHIKNFYERDNIEIIVWDHHPHTDEDIQAKELNHANIGSTSSLLALKLAELNKSLTEEEATLLSLGLHVDTGSFTFSSTTRKDFEAASYLWKCGVDPLILRSYLKTELTPAHIKALNELLESSEYHEIVDLKVVIATTSSDAYIHDFALLAPRFMEMQPCKVFFALAQMEEKVQVLARSVEKSINVGQICSAVGGGGHEYAASASVKNMTLSEVKDILIKEIYVQLNIHKTAAALMSSPVIFVNEETTMGEASKTMVRFGLKAVPVFQKNSNICTGWISQEQASRGSALNQYTMNSPVFDYMQREFKVISKNATLQDIMDIIIGEKQRLLPVVEAIDLRKDDTYKVHNCIGVVTRTDLIRLFSDENTILPMPTKAKNLKTRNLSKPLYDRVGEECVDILKLAGEIARTLNFQVSAVGGFVRDLVMDKKLRHWSELDIDFVVEGDAIKFAYALAKELNGKVRVHLAFMTATIFFRNKADVQCKLDVATARLEYYEYPAALPTIEVSSLKMDLYRRDFTINAMAIRLNPEHYGSLVDFFQGQADIRNKKVRMLHTLSFIEDPTRIIRAIRFEQRYNFVIEPQCEKLMQNAISLNLIDKLSGLRISLELELILKEENPFLALKRMEEFNLLHSIHPQLKLDQSKELLVLNLLENIEWYRKLYLNETVDALALILVALMRNAHLSDLHEVIDRFAFIEKRAESVVALRAYIIETFNALLRWFKNKDKTSKLYNLLSKKPIEVLLYCIARAEDENLKKILTQYIYKWRDEKADITGNDLEDMGIPKGKIYKELLSIALENKLDNEDFSREAQLQLVRSIYFDNLDNIQ